MRRISHLLLLAALVGAPATARTLLAQEKPDHPIQFVMTGGLTVPAGDLKDFNADAPGLARSIVSYAWQRDPYTDGAYALYKPGQWFGIRPILQRPHGKVLFAGEHIADWQGFMEGAIETGEAAAEALIGRRRAG